MGNIWGKHFRIKDYYGLLRDVSAGMGATTHRQRRALDMLKIYPSLCTHIFLHSLIVTRKAAMKCIFISFASKMK